MSYKIYLFTVQWLAEAHYKKNPHIVLQPMGKSRLQNSFRIIVLPSVPYDKALGQKYNVGKNENVQKHV